MRSLLATPDAKIDFATAKLAIDKLVDPSIDIAAWHVRIDQMVQTVRIMAGPNATTIQKLAAVRRFIYVDGEWNGHRPFQYDLTDPLGTHLVNKLLATYLTTRRGNCVSMPVLFVILADRLGVHVTLSTAPFHLFVKFVDDATGKTYNLETTNGGLPERDDWIRQQSPMTDEAVRNGLYLKTLTRKESLGVMALLLLEHYEATRRYRDVIAVAEMILKVYPNNAEAMLSEGTAYAGLIDVEFRAKYTQPIDIPASLRPVYASYARRNAELFDRTLALGWRDAEHKMTTDGPLETR